MYIDIYISDYLALVHGVPDHGALVHDDVPGQVAIVHMFTMYLAMVRVPVHDEHLAHSRLL